MKCPKMTLFGENLAPCGQCMACRINKKRLWIAKMLLETVNSKKQSSFITLTYDDEHLPENGSIDPSEIKKFLKKLRQTIYIKKIRYFAVGEYGEQTFRPHYHLVIFGYPPEEVEKLVKNCWEKGFVHIGEVTQESINYIAGYVTKKMTSKEDPRLEGKHPEFSRMSKFPPLGNRGIERIKKQLYTKQGSAAILKYQDVPKQFQMNGKKYPIGKYFINKLREEFNITNPPKVTDFVVDIETEEAEYEQSKKVELKAANRYRTQTRNRIL